LNSHKDYFAPKIELAKKKMFTIFLTMIIQEEYHFFLNYHDEILLDINQHAKKFSNNRFNIDNIQAYKVHPEQYQDT